MRSLPRMLFILNPLTLPSLLTHRPSPQLRRKLVLNITQIFKNNLPPDFPGAIFAENCLV